jgi:hypothetical protein
LSGFFARFFDPDDFQKKEMMMKLIQRLSLFIISIATAIPSISFAHTLTYTSNELLLVEGYLNGEIRDTSMIEDPYIPPFSVSLSGEINNLVGTFSLGDIVIGTYYGIDEVFSAVPVSNGSITLNESGIVQAWSFMLAITQTGFDDEYGPWGDKWVVRSEHGVGTCNCDTLFNERDLYMQRPYDQWAYYATLGELFAAENAHDNWSITTIDVAEPPVWLLMLCSLFCFGLIRRTQRHLG